MNWITRFPAKASEPMAPIMGLIAGWRGGATRNIPDENRSVSRPIAGRTIAEPRQTIPGKSAWDGDAGEPSGPAPCRWERVGALVCRSFSWGGGSQHRASSCVRITALWSVAIVAGLSTGALPASAKKPIPPPAPTITTTPSSIQGGSAETISVSGGSGNPCDWVDIMPVGSAYPAPPPLNLSMYLNGSNQKPTSGIKAATFPFFIPPNLPAGQYYFQFGAENSACNGSTIVAKTGAITVLPAAAMRAYDFYSKFGMNTDINTGQTIASILAGVQYLGIYNIRDSIFSEGYAAAFAALAAQGVKLHMDFQGWVNPAPSMSDWLKWLKTYLVTPYPGSVVGVSGPNEVDNTGSAFVYGGLSGIAAADKAQHDLYNGIKADPVLSAIPVDMWPMAFPYVSSLVAQVGDMTASCDRANMHDYYQADNLTSTYGGAPGDMQIQMAGFLGLYQQVCNRSSFVTTESGWYTPWEPGYNGQGTNEYVQTRLLLNDLFDHAMQPNNKLVYIFDLQWGSADASDPGWGVIHDDGTPKQSGVAIHNLMQILHDPGPNAATFTPSSLNYSVSGMPSASRNFIVAKSSGAFDIILWNETSIWNMSTGAQLAIPTSTVTVALPAGSSGGIYSPVQGTAPTASFSGVSQVKVNLNDAPLIIEVQ